MKKRNKIVRIMTLSLLSLCCIKPIQAQEIELKPDPSVQEKGSIHAVSYTHLDVYKRQVYVVSLGRSSMVGVVIQYQSTKLIV